MNISVGEIVVGVITAFGGCATIIGGVIHYLSEIIADRLSRKYELKLSKELEKYKSMLDNKVYISKAKFDIELEIYRNLSSSFYNMVRATTRMIPGSNDVFLVDEELVPKQPAELYEIAKQTIIDAQNILRSNIPFIPDDIYQKYNSLLKECMMVLEDYAIPILDSLLENKDATKQQRSDGILTRCNKIRTMFDEINQMTRTYLSKLDILE